MIDLPLKVGSQKRGEWILVGSAKSCRWFFPIAPAPTRYSWRRVRLAYRNGLQSFLAHIVCADRETCRMVTEKFTMGRKLWLSGNRNERRLRGASPGRRGGRGAGGRAQEKPRRSGAFFSSPAGFRRRAARRSARAARAARRAAPAGRYDSPGRCRSASASARRVSPGSPRPRRPPCGPASGRAGSSS